VAEETYRRRAARAQGRTDPPAVGGVDGRAGRHDLVDAVEHVVGKLHVSGGQLGLKMLHGPAADDRRGHGGVSDDERDRQLDDGQPAWSASSADCSAASSLRWLAGSDLGRARDDHRAEQRSEAGRT
jgi:hypothetical protein